MESLIVYPENKEQLTALKAVMKAMKVAFVQQDKEVVELPAHVLEGVRKSIRQADSGELKPYTGIYDMLKK